MAEACLPAGRYLKPLGFKERERVHPSLLYRSEGLSEREGSRRSDARSDRRIPSGGTKIKIRLTADFYFPLLKFRNALK